MCKQPHWLGDQSSRSFIRAARGFTGIGLSLESAIASSNTDIFQRNQIYFQYWYWNRNKSSIGTGCVFQPFSISCHCLPDLTIRMLKWLFFCAFCLSTVPRLRSAAPFSPGKISDLMSPLSLLLCSQFRQSSVCNSEALMVSAHYLWYSYKVFTPGMCLVSWRLDRWLGLRLYEIFCLIQRKSHSNSSTYNDVDFIIIKKQKTIFLYIAQFSG